MKKFTRSTIVVLLVSGLAGCALPEKQAIQPPPPPATPTPTYVEQQAPAYGYPPAYPQNEIVPKSPSRPGFLDLGDEEEKTVVEEDIEVSLPSMGYINDRIFEYGRKLNRWKELDSRSVGVEMASEDAELMVRCFRRLQNVLNGYSDLRTKMLQAQKISTAVAISNAEIIELQKNDIAFVENACGRLLTDSEDQAMGWTQREEGADLAQVETLIDRYDSSGEYEEVIQVWSKIPEFQLPRVKLRTKIHYGNALMYMHQEEKAAVIYKEVVDQMSVSEEQATDLVSLRKVLADLYTASGNFKAAEIQYKKISEDYLNLGRHEEWSKLQLSILDRSMEDSPELKEYSALLRNFLGFIPEQDGYNVVWQAENFLSNYPYSPVASNADFIKEAASKMADNWFNGFMAEVDGFIKERKFQEALDLLETMPIDIVSADKQMSVKAKNEEILLSEAVDKETEKMALIQELQHQWNNGMVLVKEGRYDEAIVIFTNLLDTEYSIKAETKIEEISLEAAKADRKKAAQIFVRFTKTTDLDSKKKLLVECRKVLKGILEKYPDVDIAPKVVGNIRRVEQEMNAIDPGLIYLADQPEQRAQLDGVDQAFNRTLIETPPVQTPIVEEELDVETNP